MDPTRNPALDSTTPTDDPTEAAPDVLTQPAAPAPPKTVTMPSSAVQAIRAEAKASGVKALLNQFSVKTAEELAALVDAGRKASTAQPAQTPAVQTPAATSQAGAAPAQGAPATAQPSAVEQQLRDTVAKYDRMVKALRSKITADAARADIRVAAVRAGAKDEDYVLALVERHLSKATDAEADSFDVSAFIGGLKGTHAILFEAPAPAAPAAKPVEAASNAPATTPEAPALAPGQSVQAVAQPGLVQTKPAATAPAAPPPGKPTTQQPANSGLRDARTMSDADYLKEMDALGIPRSVLS